MSASTASASSPASSRRSRCSRFLASGLASAPRTARGTDRSSDGCRSTVSSTPGPAGQPGPELRVPLRVRGVERQRAERAAAGEDGALGHHAEGVALRVGEHHPRHVALADVGVRGAELQQPGHLLVAPVAGGQVEVQPDRLGRRLGHLLEAEVEERLVPDRQPGLVDPRRVGQGLGAERGLPEPAEALRVEGVEDEVLELHASHRRRAQPRSACRTRAAERVRWSRSATLVASARGLGVQRRGDLEVAGVLVEVRARGGVPGERGVELGEGGQPGPRPVGLADRDGPVEPDDRGVGEGQQLVVPLDDLDPVGLGGARGVGVQGGDRGLGLVLAEPVAGERGLQDLDALGDRGGVPAATGPGRRAAPGGRRGRCGRCAARGAAASARAARRPRARRSRRRAAGSAGSPRPPGPRRRRTPR